MRLFSIVLSLQVSKWFVVLHGQLRLIRESDCDMHFHIGESFGVSANLKILPHRGKLVTATKDCQVRRGGAIWLPWQCGIRGRGDTLYVGVSGCMYTMY